MAKKESTVYFCSECGYESAKWMGQCPACKAWNTFVEEKVEKRAGLSSNKKRDLTDAMPVSLTRSVHKAKKERSLA